MLIIKIRRRTIIFAGKTTLQTKNTANKNIKSERKIKIKAKGACE